MQSQNQITQKILKILQSRTEAQALRQLLQMQFQAKDPETSTIYRQPILYLLQKFHDWESILKCLKQWPDQKKWQRGFYERMTRRNESTHVQNLNDYDTRRQLIKAISMNNNIHENDKNYQLHPINQIQRYLIKKNETKVFANIVKMPQLEKKHQIISNKSEDEISVRSSSINRQHLKPTLSRNSFYGGVPITSRFSTYLQNKVNLNKKQRRLTFGFGQNYKGVSRNIIDLANRHQSTVQQKTQKVKVQDRNLHLPKQTNQIFQKDNNNLNKSQNSSQRVVQINQKENLSQDKLNIVFETGRKQASSSIQTLIATRKTPRSFTRRKPLFERFERKKIILKKNMGLAQQQELFDYDQKFGEDWESGLIKKTKLTDFDDSDDQLQKNNNPQRDFQQQPNLIERNHRSGFRRSGNYNINKDNQRSSYQVKGQIKVGNNKKQQNVKLFKQKPKAQLFSNFQLSFINFEPTLGVQNISKIIRQIQNNFNQIYQDEHHDFEYLQDFTENIKKKIKQIKSN